MPTKDQDLSQLRADSRAGIAEAQLAEAELRLEKQQGLARDYRVIVRLLTACASQQPRGALLLSRLYRSGVGVPLDVEKADSLRDDAARKGQLEAMVELANSLASEKKFRSAETWAKQAHEAGDLDGTATFGFLLLRNRFGTARFEQGVELTSRAAKRGHRHAQISLGFLYSKDKRVPPNGPKAVRYFQMAAATSSRFDSDSILEQLWTIYLKGKLVRRSVTKALAWLAADAASYSEAPLIELAQIYRQGDGVRKDECLAEFWENRAREW